MSSRIVLNRKRRSTAWPDRPELGRASAGQAKRTAARPAEAPLPVVSPCQLPPDVVGRPPLSYLTWWRMTLAARVPRESDKPLAAVARHVGYSSDVAFAAAFKRELGMTLAAHRRTRAYRRFGGHSAVGMVTLLAARASCLRRTDSTMIGAAQTMTGGTVVPA